MNKRFVHINKEKTLKTLTRFIYAVVALTIVSACEKKAVLSSCVKPTLGPGNAIGSNNKQITVEIETTTPGASLSWTDNGSTPTSTSCNIIPGPKGDAITVYGRTLRAIAFKTGMDNSPVAEKTYPAPTPSPTP